MSRTGPPPPQGIGTSAVCEPLSLQRDRFDLPDDVTYLNCSYMSPMLRSVERAGAAAIRGHRPWTKRSEDFFSGAEALREAAGRLMGADAESVAVVSSVSYGIAIAASNLPIGRGQNVVLLAEQFPSNVYAWRERAEAVGARVRTVHRRPLEPWTEAVVEAIDRDTAVVSVPNCHWTDGALVDLVRVGERARAVGAALVVDASQSLGAYPIDVSVVQPDFLVSVAYKWQLGPYGLGYLYVAPRWRETARPLEASWLTRAGAEAFEALVDYTENYRPGARRFDMGGFPQFVHIPMALAGLEQLLEWGVGRVLATIAPLTATLVAECKSFGFEALPADRRVGHIVGIRLPGGIPSGLPDRLAAERVYVSIRGDSIRVAPHVYNDDEDLARLLAVLKKR